MEENVSFTQKIKEEISSQGETSIERMVSILAAFLRINGTIVFKNKKDILQLVTENAKIAKYIYMIVKTLFPDVVISFSYRKSMKFFKATEYIINVLDGIDLIKDELSINFLDDKIPYHLTNKEEGIKGYLQGIFLACGSCNSPSSSNYHLEMYVRDEAFAKAVLKLLNKVKDYRFDFKYTKRRNNYTVYLKKSDQISSYIAYLDASNSCLEFENVRVDRDFSNVTNRLMNCDAYNYKKSVNNAKEQIEQIKFLDRRIGIKLIENQKLRLLCELRLEQPEATYNDLAEMLSEKLDVKVSKSNVNHLFIKIRKMAEQYGQEQ